MNSSRKTDFNSGPICAKNIRANFGTITFANALKTNHLAILAGLLGYRSVGKPRSDTPNEFGFANLHLYAPIF